jgi:hypothetical protein
MPEQAAQSPEFPFSGVHSSMSPNGMNKKEAITGAGKRLC